jgi:hypothetical protein
VNQRGIEVEDRGRQRLHHSIRDHQSSILVSSGLWLFCLIRQKSHKEKGGPTVHKVTANDTKLVDL